MGDHFVFLVDRLLTESTLEAAIESQNRLRQTMASASKENTKEFSPHWMDLELTSLAGKSVECRICHEEEDDMNMEMPCSCRGSLKYAHRKCVQRWCNEKGNTICEICHQQFEPGYTAPPPLFCYGAIPMNFRGNWEIPRRDLHNPPSIAMVTTDHEFLDSDFDEYSAPSPRSVMCCRIIAIIWSWRLLNDIVYVTDIENSWDSSACLCHGQSIYCYSTSGSAAGSSFSPC